MFCWVYLIINEGFIGQLFPVFGDKNKTKKSYK